MKRLLFQLSSVICCLILISSCETNVIDGVQYIQGPGDCIENYYVIWNNETLTLEPGSYICFKSKIKGELHFEYSNNALITNGGVLVAWSGFVVYVDGEFVDAYTGFQSNNGKYAHSYLKSIKQGAIIKIEYDGKIWDSSSYCSSLLKNIHITSKPSNNTNTDNNPDSGFDF